jgi:CheY-like chemotaxis protein
MEYETDPQQTGIGKTVLVADDSVVIRRALVGAFLSDGFKTCIGAKDGIEAVDAAKKNKLDLIILDLSMPVMNGIQAAIELRKLLPRIPIILFTLYAEGLLEKEATNAGINLVLEKSMPIAALIDSAHKLMAN